jgi:CRISPR-associated protein Cmr5
MQTMQQRRAKYALEQVTTHAGNPQVDRKEYKAYAAALPAMIHMNGLGQAAAFYRAKGGNHGRLYVLLSEWLTRPGQPLNGEQDLLEAICNADMAHYRLAQAEAQALMDWVVKLARALMPTADAAPPAAAAEQADNPEARP